MTAISSDALREAARYTLTDESFINVNHLSFEGDVSFHRSGESKDESHTKHFRQEITQEDLTWKTIVGLINYYDRKAGTASLAIEGMAITPELVNSLSLKHLVLKAVFVGFTDDSYLNTILGYAHAKKDWVYKKIVEEDGGDDSAVRKWFADEVIKNKRVERIAKEHGYGFFSPNGDSFEDYCSSVVRYLSD